MKLVLGVSYCGHDYFGWQRQSHSNNTVQHYIDKALSAVAAETITSVCAGRTDSGVHATQQVIHIETKAIRTPRGWQMGANTQLPKNIRINWAQPVTEDFHARFSAKYRRYQYIIEDNSSGNAIFSRQLSPYRFKLNEDLMHQAAQYLLGEQDFSAFRASQCQSKSTYRHIDFINVYRKKQFIIIDVQANAFLYHMVRNIVGSLLWVGQQKKPPRWIDKLLKQKDRCLAAPTAIANGLYLVEVGYDSVYNVPVNQALLPFV